MGGGKLSDEQDVPAQRGQQQPDAKISKFVRTNPRSDRLTFKRFHHVEIWCTDATNCSRRFSCGLGMPIVAKSDISTGNLTHTSYLLRSGSGQLSFLFTAPRYSPDPSSLSSSSGDGASIPTFSSSAFTSFYSKHGGIAVRAIAVEVEDASYAFSSSVSAGAISISPPILLPGDAICPATLIAELQLYGDVVLRYVSYVADKNLIINDSAAAEVRFLPKFATVEEANNHRINKLNFGLKSLDHVLGNVHDMSQVVTYLKRFTGFHEFAEFSGDETGTTESGSNVTMLANNDERVLLAVGEPMQGTKSKGTVDNYLKHNGGAGVQHVAMGTDDIFQTLRKMSAAGGGFEFMPSPPPNYYRNLKRRVGDVLSDDMIKECEEMGIMVDRDDQGVILQIFTTHIGDRPTMFLEVIQRIGGMEKDDEGNMYQKGGCGGFGKGNIIELYKSVEKYEKTLQLESN